MKTYQIKILSDADIELVHNLLNDLANKGTIEISEKNTDDEEAEPASEDQVQEIIEESEIGPYYSEKEAKEILNL
ncbi:hypothetical protein [Dyadobacter psychrotolerans]|uniref:Uncharacterized protein n=1 Tax=Dyadobacter psychrotolerans TaxID=2541721 RepID=A0A4V2Z4Y6_9BACT|nr:hypothetical protein [Dyadobacter psychrotolerans]TDE18518.1 hypothetical protein E0F88_02985 [Dyadobacter psychrotolerans]